MTFSIRTVLPIALVVILFGIGYDELRWMALPFFMAANNSSAHLATCFAGETMPQKSRQ